MRPRRFGVWLLVLAFALTLLPILGQHWFPQTGRASEDIATLGGGWAWGDDGATQLGNGPANDGGSATTPVQNVGLLGIGTLANITAVAGGSTHSLALRSNGTVVAWGNDTFGQLGNGAATDNATSNVPVEVSNLTNVVAIGAGGQHSIALRRDGTVWTWGNDGSGQLGMGGGPPNDCDPGAGTRPCANIPVQVLGTGGSGLLTNVIAIAAGNAHNLALRSDGTVVTWGDDTFGQLGNGLPNNGVNTTPVAVTGLSNVIAIAAGGFHSLALKRDSTVASWGNDFRGQLGNGLPYDGNFSDITQQVSNLTNVIAIAAGRDHSLALKSDGTVSTWGFDEFGQLGNGVTGDGGSSNVPVGVGGPSGVTAIAGGTSHSMARKSDGTVSTWGRNNLGQLGNGSTTQSSIPLTLGSPTNVVAIAAGGTHSLAIRSGTQTRTWGGNLYGQFGNGGFAPDDCDPGAAILPCANIALPVTTLNSVVAAAAGELHSVALTSDGTVWSWGDDSTGQLGNGVGTPNSCNAPFFTPCALSPVPVSGLGNVVAVAAGERHSVALLRDGTVWAWGSNVLGQLGNGGLSPDDCDSGPGTLPCRISPVQVSGLTNIVAIAAGGSHSLALRDDGSVYAWGRGTSGQLGNGVSSGSNVPVQVSGLTNAVTKVAAGGNHSLALRSDGTVVAWGSDASGQLGNGGAATNSPTPISVGGLANIAAVAAGGSHSVAVRGDGTVAAWGAASPALLGNGGVAPDTCGATACALAPVTVTSLINIVAVAAGAVHNIAIAPPADTTSVNATGAPSATYGTASVALSATITNTGGATSVNEGTVTFTVRNSSSAIVGSPVTSGTVVGGTASVNFPLTGVTAGSYTVHVTYSGSTNFLTSTDLTPATLTISKANTSVTANSATANYGATSVSLGATVQNTSNGATLTGGTVTFTVSGVCTSGAISIPTSASSATVNFTCNLGSAAAGSYTISATYSGDTNFNGSVGSNTLTFSKASTATTVGNVSATYGDASVTLTGSVANTTNNASFTGGTVQFTVTQGATTVCSVTSAAVVGTAPRPVSVSCPLTVPIRHGAGSYTIAATYSGDTNFSGSTATAGTLTIAKATSTIAVTNVSGAYGSSVQFSATVQSVNGVALTGGNVTFGIGGGGCAPSAGVTPGSASVVVNAACNFGTKAPGTYALTASYSGDANMNGSSATPGTVTIAKATTTTAAANITGAYGGSVQLSATVENTSNAANLTGGTVQFVVTQGATTVCTVTSGTVAGSDPVTAQATCALGTAAPGIYNIVATYSGDGNFNGSTNSLTPATLTLSKADTTTTLGAVAVTYGVDNATLTASIANLSNAANLTGGTVQFVVTQGATSVCNVTSGAVVGTDPTSVTASCPLTVPTRHNAGEYNIAATYSGDANFNGSSSTGTPPKLTIATANTTTAVTNATATYGDNSVQLSATVDNTPNAAAITGGTVTFTISGVCTVVSPAISGSDTVTASATCPLTAPSRHNAGSYTIAATYSGDTNFNTSTNTGTLTINKAASTTTVVSVSGPYGGSVQLSATVQTSNGVALTGGNVTFGVASLPACSATVAVATGAASSTIQANCPLGTATAGPKTLTATYNGDTNVATSSATPGAVTIVAASTSISVGDVTIAFGNATATLNATVLNASNGANLTGGTVDFNVPGICDPAAVSIPTTASSASVTASCATVGDAVGIYSIEASYSGHTNFAASTATLGTLTIGTANTTTVAASATATYGGGTVQLSATVQSATGANLTGGAVTFAVTGGCNSGALTIPTVPPSTTANVTFDCPLTTTSGGPHTITATFSGDGSFNGSSDTDTLTITKANTSTTTSGLAATYGAGTVQLNATVQNTSNGGNLSGGTVNFTVNGVCSPSVAVPAGASNATVNASCVLGTAAPGTYALVATYSGDGNFNTSTSSPTVTNLTITKANTSVQVTNISTAYGTPNAPQLQATIANTSSGAALTGGTATFTVAGVCTSGALPVPTSGASVPIAFSCPIGTIAPGIYPISVSYSGNPAFNGSTGAGTLTIAKRTPAVTVSDVLVGIGDTTALLTAIVSSGDPAVNLTGGNLTLAVSDGVCSSGSQAIAAGSPTRTIAFTCPLNNALAGTYTITGNYSGDANFNAASDTGTLTIDQPLVALTVTFGNGSVRLQSSATNELLTASATRQFSPGTQVTATAQPGGGYTFMGWTRNGVDVGWANPVSLTLDSDNSLVARFAATPNFADVPNNQSYTTAVNELAARGLIRGYNSTTYGPNDQVQRSQMAALIARAIPTGPDTPPGGLLTPPACLVAGSWDCEDWGNEFSDQNGADPNLWRNVGALQHYGVANGYGNGTFGPFDQVTYAQTISFITRAMVAKGYWVPQPNESVPYTGVPTAHLIDVQTYHFYTQGVFGGVPDGFSDWNSASTRGWFARALWAAVNSYFSVDQPDKGGYIP